MTELMHLSLFCHCVSCWCICRSAFSDSYLAGERLINWSRLFL
jgi:hypothetical protein